MLKPYLKYRKKAISYFEKHPEYNATVHALGGIGIGIVLASPLAFPHPIRWAVVFISLSLAGHLYALTQKK